MPEGTSGSFKPIDSPNSTNASDTINANGSTSPEDSSGDPSSKESTRQGAQQKWTAIKEQLKRPVIYIPLIFLIVLIAVIASVTNRYTAGSRSADGTKKSRFNPFAQSLTEKKVTSDLDGLRYPESEANRHVLGVMIENHPDARPQFGLTSASVVYEAIAEGGITRFLAIFGPKLADKVGPVRSARTYYLDWCLEYDCFYSHVGGNIEALDLIPSLGIKDLDQFRYGVKAYGRQPRKGIATEHTMYANPNKLYDLARANSWTQTGGFPVITFKEDAPTKDRPTSQSFSVAISSKQFETAWTYDPSTNLYARTMAGQPHLDGATSQQIKSKVVIVQEVPSQNTVTRINEQGLILQTVGSGKATIFQDGIMTEGTWKKASKKERTIFFDASGKEIYYNPGQRWITIVNPGTKITINPE
jgi:hypothetical protein